MTEINDGETIDVECIVDLVYPVDDLEFQLMSGDTVVSSRELGDSTETNSDGTFRVTKMFSLMFSSSYSFTEAGLVCKAYHSKGNSESGRLYVIVTCKCPSYTYVVM